MSKRTLVIIGLLVLSSCQRNIPADPQQDSTSISSSPQVNWISYEFANAGLVVEYPETYFFEGGECGIPEDAQSSERGFILKGTTVPLRAFVDGTRTYFASPWYGEFSQWSDVEHRYMRCAKQDMSLTYLRDFDGSRPYYLKIDARPAQNDRDLERIIKSIAPHCSMKSRQPLAQTDVERIEVDTDPRESDSSLCGFPQLLYFRPSKNIAVLITEGISDVEHRPLLWK